MSEQTLAEILPREPERHFQTRVVKLAQVFGWRIFHPWISIRSAAGWPDLFMVRRDQAIAAELKTMRGRFMPEQNAWLEALGEVPGIAVYKWRPKDWDEIVAVLR
jgi:hypothetical protein